MILIRYYRFPENVLYTCCVCMLSFVGCQDDPYWRDSKYGGDGNARCIDLTLDWCNNHGQYSKEAQRACPASCGLCKGIFVNCSKLRPILLKQTGLKPIKFKFHIVELLYLQLQWGPEYLSRTQIICPRRL